MGGLRDDGPGHSRAASPWMGVGSLQADEPGRSRAASPWMGAGSLRADGSAVLCYLWILLFLFLCNN
jgi:hypothetical protein